ncbi:hypothetical protein RJT34_24634 [Clitoria ternatea]|uniref:Uncharacterized protein n=1 Tax=Clitoria ternatea TaxID=43366 RepID=A0AAN9ILA3_CLITE
MRCKIKCFLQFGSYLMKFLNFLLNLGGQMRIYLDKSSVKSAKHHLVIRELNFNSRKIRRCHMLFKGDTVPAFKACLNLNTPVSFLQTLSNAAMNYRQTCIECMRVQLYGKAYLSAFHHHFKVPVQEER